MVLSLESSLIYGLTGWYKNKRTIKLILVLLAAYLVVIAIMGVLGWGLVASLLGSDIITPDATPSLEFIQSLTVGIFALLSVFAIILIVMSIFQHYIVALIKLEALKQLKRKTVKFNPEKFIMLLIYYIVKFFAVLLSLFELKFLLVGIGGLVLIILGIGIAVLFPLAGIPLLFLGMLALLAYLIIIVYNSIRLLPSDGYFLEKETGIMQALEKSWKATEGKVLNIFVYALVFGIVVMILIQIVSAIFSGIGFGIGAMFGDLSAVVIFSYVLAIAASFIVTPFVEAFDAYFIMSIYDGVSKK